MTLRRALSLVLCLCMLMGMCSVQAEEVCPHEGNVEEWTEIEGQYVSNDDQTHTLSGDRYYTRFCHDCGTVIEHELVEANVSETSDHHYYEWKEDWGIHVFTGVCSACGHEHSCQHDGGVHVDENSIPNGVYTVIDDKTHSVTGNRFIDKACEKCGHSFSMELVERNATITREHSYHEWNEEWGIYVFDGVCNDCGHVTNCDHSGAVVEENRMYDAVYTSVDNDTHAMTGDRYVVLWCENCDADVSVELAEKNATITEGHHYDEYNEELGFHVYESECNVCGHVDTCPHDDVQINENRMENAQYTPIDAREHSVTGDRYISTDCNLCGRGGVSLELAEKDASYEEGHNFGYWDDELEYEGYTGVCDGCGYVNECTHENAEVWEELHGQTFVDNGDRTHTATGRLYICYVCYDCQWGWQEYAGDNVSREYDHEYWYWDEENQTDVPLDACHQCGHVNPCTHENADRWQEVWDATYETVDGGIHLATGRVYDRMHCNDCELDLTVLAEENGTIEEGHYFYHWDEEMQMDVYDGDCEGCGYVNECEHENAEHWQEVWDATYEYVDENIHLATGLVVDRMYCHSCGADTSVLVEENGTMEEGHWFWYHDDSIGRDVFDGECDACGYVSECEHENADYWQEAWDATYEYADEYNHLATGRIYDCMHCHDCGAETIVLVEENGTIEEGHHFWHYDEEIDRDIFDGECEACGYVSACTHENADRWQEAWDATYEYADENIHLATGRVVDRMHCNDCGADTSVLVDENGTIEEGHHFWYYDEEMDRDIFDGECEGCGYVSACTHENADRWQEVWDATSYEMIDGDSHWATGRVYDCMSCGDCGAETIVLADENGTIEEGHYFWYWHDELQTDAYDGVCEGCGYANPCEHPNAEMVGFYCTDGAAVDNGNETHAWVGRIYDWYYCEECDVVWPEFAGENESRNTYHIYWYEDEENDTDVMTDECTECGHVRTCEHENAERWYEIDGEMVAKDGRMHEASGERIDWIDCPDCHNLFRIRSGEIVTEEEDHSFHVWSEDGQTEVFTGVCETCGYEVVCEHKNTWVREEVPYDTEIEEIDDRVHGLTGKQYRITNCEDCGNDIVIEPTGEVVTIEDNHHYYCYDEATDSDVYTGECGICGHVNACEHENADYWYDIEGERVSVNDRVHSATGEKINYGYCPDCDVEFLREATGEIVTEEENHYYYRYDEATDTEVYTGECEACGHKNTCEHENADYWYDIEGERVSVNDRVHSATGEKINYGYCPDCDAEILREATGEIVIEEEDHFYYFWDEELGTDMYDGECEACGHVNACKHEGEVYVDEYDMRNTGECEGVDHLTHQVTGDRYINKWCADCEQSFYMELVEKNVTVTVNHWYDGDNVCGGCGFICQHTERGISYYIDDFKCVYTQIDADNHLISGPKYEVERCKSCRIYFWDDMVLIDENGSFPTPHTFEDGVCVWCGWDEWITEYTAMDATGTVAAETTDLIDKPSEEGKALAQAAEGDKLSVKAELTTADGKDWYEVDLDGKKAYIGKAAVTIDVEPDPTPTPTPTPGPSDDPTPTPTPSDDPTTEPSDEPTDPPAIVTGWVEENGKWYYHDENGEKVTDCWMKDSIGWVYLGSDGAMKTDAWVMDSKGWCYVGSNGYAVTNCWKQDSAGWCYLDSEGSMVKNAWVRTDGEWYWLDGDGYKVTNGWVLADGEWYWLDGEGRKATNCWMKDSIGWVYLGSDGAMKTNSWVMDSKGWCYVGSDGYAVTNCWKQDSVGWCYLDSEGSMVKNAWVRTDGEWYWLNGDGYKETDGWVYVDGNWYWLDSEGRRASSCWMKDSVGWVYLGSDGAMKTNSWVRDSQGWCYVGADGYAVTNCWKQDSTGWCYLDANGSMVKNQWLQDGGNWYYLNGEGYRATGTVVIDGKEEQFDSNGVWLG